MRNRNLKYVGFFAICVGALGAVPLIGPSVSLAQRDLVVRPAVDSKAQPAGGLKVKQFTIPTVAGEDRVKVTMLETYEIEGVGRDEVVLTGMFVMRRGAPLLDHDETEPSWERSTVVAEFAELNLVGKSDVFGTVVVSLDRTQPNFAAVKAGKCVTNVQVNVDMPDLGMTLRMQDSMQLRSTVQTVPPVGDEKTESVRPVKLLDADGRVRGTLEKARVSWRELLSQKSFQEVRK